MRSRFRVLALTPPGRPDPAIAIAASRAGETGVLDLEYVRDREKTQKALSSLDRHARKSWGIKLGCGDAEFAKYVLEALPQSCSLLILTSPEESAFELLANAGRERQLSILVEVLNQDSVPLAEGISADGIVAKGNEAGGFVSSETAFILLQRLSATTKLPIYAQGGIGLHTVAACAAAGAAGAVLDTQLLLTLESPLNDAEREMVGRLDGSETVCLNENTNSPCRVHARPGFSIPDGLSGALTGPGRRRTLQECAGWDSPQGLRLMGQDVSFAPRLAKRFHTTGAVMEAIRRSIGEHLTCAAACRALDECAPLAKSHGTRYPIVQGPMTRVSDTAAFASSVAQAGGLPFLALALMKGDEATALLEATSEALGKLPWGAGILGFVPVELREQQLLAIRKTRPKFALIAGGRPDQASELEGDGIATYLHVPSPALLASFLESGARRFVFEGRECGGHTGPRSSFVLWESMIEVLIESLPEQDLKTCCVLFAAGIHDELSASMVAALSGTLASAGVQIGVLLGTAYLFTKEAVAAGAIVPQFQDLAVRCRSTVLLDSGPGHSIRCIDTPYRGFFEREKARLRAEGATAEQVRGSLEELNVGRLRIASKGVTRSPTHRPSVDAPKFVTLAHEQQIADGMYMIGQLAALRDSVVSIHDLHRSVSVGGTARLLDVAGPSAPTVKQEDAGRPADVAIIGFGCMFPKAPNLRAFWENILDKTDCITEIPADRWDWKLYFDQDPSAPDKVTSKWGGFLDEIPFDPVRYGIPPAALRSTDPLHLLTLEAVRMALEDAGYSDGRLTRERTSVIVGAGGGIADLGQQYAFRSALPMFGIQPDPNLLEQLPKWTEDSFPGLLVNVAAGRVANRFDLGGVNFTVDAACASSLAAVYLGLRELESGTSDVVLVGGADTMQNPFAYTCFSKTHALSPRGRCSTFDEQADGIAISEGVAVAVLKRLVDAERDGDRVYAVIRATRGSSDGRARGLTAPRPEGQLLALQRAYAQAGFSPATVGLIEAHGTGTVAGDQAEVTALRRVFENGGANPRSCAIGSVKSMIGHTKCTAGMAGLIKTALALHHKVLPPTIGVNTPNTAAAFDRSPFYVNSDTRPWIHSDSRSPRRAGVSAFGFGGTNFHAVLEEYCGEYRPAMRDGLRSRRAAELVTFAASSPDELLQSVGEVESALARGAVPVLRDIAYTLWQRNVKRSDTKIRLGIVATDLDDLRRKMAVGREKLTAGETNVHDPRGVWLSDRSVATGARIGILFPGQGSQYPDMLRDLAVEFPEVRIVFEESDRALQDELSHPLSTFIFPPPRFGPEEEKAAQQALTSTDIAQPALGAAGLAALQLLHRFGIKADAFAGHSYGEYVALCAANVIDPITLMRLSHARGKAILDSASGDLGTMLAVDAGAADVAALISNIAGVWVSNRNSPSQTVLSGHAAALDKVAELLASKGVNSRAVPVACGFHSPLVSAARNRFAQTLQSVQLKTATIPVYSNNVAQPYPADPAEIAGMLADHLVRPVDFMSEIEAMYADGIRVFIEAGPRAVLTRLVQQTLGNKPHMALPIDAPGQPGIVQLARLLAQLWVNGAAIDLMPLFAGRAAKLLRFEDLGAPEPLSSTIWMVNGGKARPAHQGKAITAQPGRIEQPLAAARPAAKPPQPTAPAPIHSANGSTSDDSSEAVMLRFQELMRQFLDTQRQVMSAYFGNGVRAGVPNVPTIEIPDSDPPIDQVNAPQTIPSKPLADSAEPPNAVPEKVPQDLTAALLELVSERTGYPTEMLGLDLNMEAELGIDSIKRVEIVTAFKKMCGGPEQSRRQLMDVLTGVKTLRAIVDIFAGTGAQPATPEKTAGPVGQPFDVPRLMFRETPVASQRDSALKGLYLITNDELGVAECLSRLLKAQGAQTYLVSAKDGAREFHLEGAEIDLRNESAIAALADHVQRTHGVVRGILHLSPLRKMPEFENLDLAGWRRAASLDVKALFLLARANAASLRSGGCVISAGFADDVTPLHGGMAGMLYTLAVEWPDAQVRAVEFDGVRRVQDVATHLMDEILNSDGERFVRYRQAQRLGLHPFSVPVDDRSAGPSPIDSDSVVLITGGARGITAQIARELVARHRPKVVVLAGRSPLPEEEEDVATRTLSSVREIKTVLSHRTNGNGAKTTAALDAEYKHLMRAREIRETLRTLRDSGAEVRYQSVDVRDSQAFGDFIDEIYSLFGRIDCVIHGAGLIVDKLIEDKTAASFDLVFDTKVDSTFVLARKLRPESLRLLVLFSSVAGSFGSRGQIAYTAANAVLNRVARRLDREWQARVVAINWGPWSGAGMVSPEVGRQFEELGIRLLSPDLGREAFHREIVLGRKGEPVVVIGWGPWAADSRNVLQPVLYERAPRGLTAAGAR